MRRDVSIEEFRALPGSKGWEFDPRYQEIWGKAQPDNLLSCQIRPTRGFDHCPGIPLGFIMALAGLFETTNVSIQSEMDHDLSELTPGTGPDIWVEVRPSDYDPRAGMEPTKHGRCELCTSPLRANGACLCVEKPR